MTDEPPEIGVIAQQICGLAEQVRDTAGGLLADESPVPDVVNAGVTLVAAMRDQARLLTVMADHVTNRAGVVVVFGASDEQQAGRDFCAKFAADARALAAAVRANAASIAGDQLGELAGVLDVDSCRLTKAEEASCPQFWRLVEESSTESSPIDAYDDDTAAEYAARWQADETPAGRRISVYEVVDQVQLPDVVFSAPGTGGERGLVASDLHDAA